MKNLLKVFLFLSGFFLINTTVFSQVYFRTGDMQVRVTAYGAVRIYTIVGEDTLVHFDRACILNSGNLNEVFDYTNDLDIVEETYLVDNPSNSDFEVAGVFDNNYSGLPPNFKVQQNVYGWNDAEYIILKYNIKNQESVTFNSYSGLNIIANVNYTYEGDTVSFNPDNSVLSMYDSTHIGFKLLNKTTHSAHIFEWFEEYEDSDTSFYSMLSDGLKDTALKNTDEDGAVAIISTEPFTFAPNDSVSIYYAIAIGDDEAGMLAAIAAAEEKYTDLTSVTRHDILPSSFNLSQNYPNPFNPSTNITFDIPVRENVTLKVYNVLGQEVATLVNNEMEAGRYTVNFNAASLSSGMYIYQVTAGSYQSTKKMTLIK